MCSFGCVFKYLFHPRAELLSIVKESNIIKFLAIIFNDLRDQNSLTLRSIHARIGLLLLSLCAVTGAQALELKIAQEIYRLELATTPEQRRLGLMHRSELGRYEGMLLVYPHAGDHRIWMKNVLVALRVYWLDEQFEVIGAQRLEPCYADPCPIYAVDGASRYVLELSDHEHPLRIGDRLHGIRVD